MATKLPKGGIKPPKIDQPTSSAEEWGSGLYPPTTPTTDWFKGLDTASNYWGKGGRLDNILTTFTQGGFNMNDSSSIASILMTMFGGMYYNGYDRDNSDAWMTNLLNFLQALQNQQFQVEQSDKQFNLTNESAQLQRLMGLGMSRDQAFSILSGAQYSPQAGNMSQSTADTNQTARQLSKVNTAMQVVSTAAQIAESGTASFGNLYSALQQQQQYRAVVDTDNFMSSLMDYQFEHRDNTAIPAQYMDSYQHAASWVAENGDEELKTLFGRNKAARSTYGTQRLGDAWNAHFNRDAVYEQEANLRLCRWYGERVQNGMLRLQGSEALYEHILKYGQLSTNAGASFTRYTMYFDDEANYENIYGQDGELTEYGTAYMRSVDQTFKRAANMAYFENSTEALYQAKRAILSDRKAAYFVYRMYAMKEEIMRKTKDKAIEATNWGNTSQSTHYELTNEIESEYLEGTQHGNETTNNNKVVEWVLDWVEWFDSMGMHDNYQKFKEDNIKRNESFQSGIETTTDLLSLPIKIAAKGVKGKK